MKKNNIIKLQKKFNKKSQNLLNRYGDTDKVEEFYEEYKKLENNFQEKHKCKIETGIIIG